MCAKPIFPSRRKKKKKNTGDPELFQSPHFTQKKTDPERSVQGPFLNNGKLKYRPKNSHLFHFKSRTSFYFTILSSRNFQTTSSTKCMYQWIMAKVKLKCPNAIILVHKNTARGSFPTFAKEPLLC